MSTSIHSVCGRIKRQARKLQTLLATLFIVLCAMPVMSSVTRRSRIDPLAQLYRVLRKKQLKSTNKRQPHKCTQTQSSRIRNRESFSFLCADLVSYT